MAGMEERVAKRAKVLNDLYQQTGADKIPQIAKRTAMSEIDVERAPRSP